MQLPAIIVLLLAVGMSQQPKPAASVPVMSVEGRRGGVIEGPDRALVRW